MLVYCVRQLRLVENVKKLLEKAHIKAHNIDVILRLMLIEVGFCSNQIEKHHR